MLRQLVWLMAAALIFALLPPSPGWSQTTDRSAMDQGIKDTAN